MAACSKIQPKRILIVEDDGIIAFEIQDRLQQLGYSVPEIARTGDEALSLVRRHSFDVVLMDIGLAGRMDGIATAQALRKEAGDVPVVYVTAYSDSETIRRARLTRPLAFIVKPFADADLLNAVQLSTYKHQPDKPGAPLTC